VVQRKVARRKILIRFILLVVFYIIVVFALLLTWYFPPAAPNSPADVDAEVLYNVAVVASVISNGSATDVQSNEEESAGRMSVTLV